MRLGPALVAVGAVAIIGCGAVNVRPYLTPLPDAFVDTLRAQPEELTRMLATAVAAESFVVRVLSTDEGYLETSWFDVRTRQPGGTGRPRRDVRLRFFIDPLGQGDTQLVAEAVYRPRVDPSLPPREQEAMAPPDHPGGQILRRILESVRLAYGAGRS